MRAATNRLKSCSSIFSLQPTVLATQTDSSCGCSKGTSPEVAQVSWSALACLMVPVDLCPLKGLERRFTMVDPFKLRYSGNELEKLQ